VNILNVVGQNVRLLRGNRGLTQEALAIKAGLRRSYIGHIERGDRNLTLTNLNQIAAALNVHPSVLLLPKAFQYDI
jgi:transcriptional regulator with XRE-family HTH domain